ncbi:hypothetical protein M0813_05144 [Anaeramoeba flamelloides]|uniref:PB1 domain-containing protein n=1 Tax=Anaeramoeba flamelloides TaxID=1746091 RepID=A0ABQ8XHV2_9EUKA|nr:hypothetical protein M0813_05144 [Anaeramoeba flamelloides]
MTNKMQKVMSIKVHFGNEIRRWSMQRNGSYNDLCLVLNKLFQIDVSDRKQYSLQYKDDEDEFVVFTTDLELREAIRFASTSERPLLRLFIVKAKSKKQPQKQKKKTVSKNGQQKRTNGCQKRRCCNSPFNFMNIPSMFFFPPELTNIFNDLVGLGDRVEKLVQNKKVVGWFKEVLPRLQKIFESLIENGAIEIETVHVQIQSLLEESKLSKEIQKEITNLSTPVINKIVQGKYLLSDLPIGQLFKNFFGKGLGKVPFPFPMNGMFCPMMKGMFPQKNCPSKNKCTKKCGFKCFKESENENLTKNKEQELELEQEKEKEKEIELEKEKEKEKEEEIVIEKEKEEEEEFIPLEEIEQFFEVKETKENEEIEKIVETEENEETQEIEVKETEETNETKETEETKETKETEEIKETKETKETKEILKQEMEYEEEMIKLIEIGLVDLELNLKLLKKFKGNVRKTANAILSNNY